jgi:hypothetical protein
MSIHITQWLIRRRWLLIAVGVPVLVALWWAFRPEKLWINQTVNEAAPFATSGDPEPILTGRFSGDAQQASGRATIYKKPGGGRYLQLSDFTTPGGAESHVLLVRSDDQNLSQAVAGGNPDDVDLGSLKSNQGDQTYDLPTTADLNKYDAVAIYHDGGHAILGLAKLEKF